MLRRRRPTAPSEPSPTSTPTTGDERGPAPDAAEAPAPAVRWTEHGPEAPAPVAEEPARVVDEPLAMPALPNEPPVTDAPGDGAPAEDLDTIRARLAARGLVRTEPSVRIRDIAGGRPDSPPAPIAPSKGDPFEPAPSPEDSVSDDAEALDPEPFGPTALTRCPSCRTTQQVAVDATGYKCDNCDKVWRWGVCTSCSHLSLTMARQESWRCTGCGAYSRSWWRTATAPREAQEVTRRKRADAAEQERQRVLAIARRRRWKLILGGVMIVLLAGASALIFRSTDTSSPAEHTRVTCANWTRLKSDIANGALTAVELDNALRDLADGAELAQPEVHLAADRLADAGRPGQATFLVASTQLSDACAAER